MTLWRWLMSMACLAVLVAGAKLSVHAQDKGDKLEWKAFEKGKVFYQELTTKTEQNMKVMQQDIKQTQEQTFYLKWTAKEQDKAGDWIVTQEIIGVKMSIDIGGNKISYDSLEPNPPNNPMTDFFNALKKLELTLTIGPDLKVKDVSGQDKLIKDLAKTNPQMEPLLKTILSKNALVQMAEPTWGPFPPKGSLEKKTWDGESKLDLGPIGTYVTKFEYSHQGADEKDKGKDKIGIKATLTYTAPSKEASGGLPFVIKSATLASKKGEGSAVFDRAKGRFDKTTMDMRLEGKLDIEVGGMTTSVTLDQTQNATVTTTDTVPQAVQDAEKKKDEKKKS